MCSSVRRLLIADARIEPRIGDVGQDVGDHDGDADDDEDAHQHRIVAREDRVEGQAADAGPREHRLGQHRAGDQRPQVEADDGDDRQDGVPQRMHQHDAALRHALRAGIGDVFQAQHVDHAGARDPRDQRQVEDRQRDGRQDQVVQDVERPPPSRSGRIASVRMPCDGNRSSQSAKTRISIWPSQNAGTAKPISEMRLTA